VKKVEITKEMLELFVGGQLKVTNTSNNIFGCGKIATISFNQDVIIFYFEWFAQNDDFFSLDSEWFWQNSTKEKRLSLQFYAPTEIFIGGIRFVSIISPEVFVLTSDRDQMIDPSTIKGLVPAKA